MSNTPNARFETLVDIFHASVKKYARNELFGVKKGAVWQWSTYEQFGKDVDKLRGGLAALGFTRGDKIAIVSNNRPEWAIAAYACFGLGVAFVPMYEAQLEKDWEFIARDCEAKGLIVATDAILEKSKKFLETIPSLKHIINLGGANGAANEGVTTYKALLDSGKDAPTIAP